MLRNTSCGHDGECCQEIVGLQSWKGLWGFPASVSLLSKQENTHPDWWNLWLLAAKPKLVILSPTQATLEPAPMVRIQNSKESFQSIEQLTEVLNIREPAFLGSHRAPGHSWRASPLIHARIISISLIFFFCRSFWLIVRPNTFLQWQNSESPHKWGYQARMKLPLTHWKTQVLLSFSTLFLGNVNQARLLSVTILPSPGIHGTIQASRTPQECFQSWHLRGFFPPSVWKGKVLKPPCFDIAMHHIFCSHITKALVSIYRWKN